MMRPTRRMPPYKQAYGGETTKARSFALNSFLIQPIRRHLLQLKHSHTPTRLSTHARRREICGDCCHHAAASATARVLSRDAIARTFAEIAPILIVRALRPQQHQQQQQQQQQLQDREITAAMVAAAASNSSIIIGSSSGGKNNDSCSSSCSTKQPVGVTISSVLR